MELTVKCKGLEEILFSRPVKYPKHKNPKTEQQEIENALERYYKNSNGVYIPKHMIKATMLCGIRMQKMKIERSNVRALNLAKVLINIQPEEILIEPLRKELTEDDLTEIPMTLDQGKMKWLIYPTVKLPWEISFTIIFHEMLERNFVIDALTYGGLLCGIGARDKGKFEVEII